MVQATTPTFVLTLPQMVNLGETGQFGGPGGYGGGGAGAHGGIGGSGIVIIRNAR